MRNIVVKFSLSLTVQQRKKLEDAFYKKYGDEELFFRYLEDKNLLGGVVIEDGERIYDASVASSLYDFKRKGEEYVNQILSDKKSLPENWKEELLDSLDGKAGSVEYGRVTESADGIITVEGLTECRYFELLEIDKGSYAIAMNLMTDCVKAMLISDGSNIEYGDIVKGTGKIVEVPVGDALLGRVVNPLGKPLDGNSVLHCEKKRPIESPAPGIIERSKVSRPLMTGILAIDSMVPIGRGQRELIIGDRQTGKTSIAVDAIINQRKSGVICIYVAIGQRAGTVAKIIERLKNADAMKNTVIVASTADDNAALQYIAPYTGCAIGEEFMSQGKDVLIVYDDLSKHANAYRTISLLLKRPSGREAYPGDVFYIHSRLLERSAQLADDLGGGSMTALPLIETQAGDISQYIPTNVISITDGQIYLESELFHSGVRPAVNVGLSVSRVGGSAQYPAIRKLASKLRLDLAHYRELAVFSQFGGDMDESTGKILESGRKITEMLKQAEGAPMSVDKQIIYLYLINGHIDNVPIARIKEYMEGFYQYFVNSDYSDLKTLRKQGVLTDEIRKVLDADVINYDIYFFKEKKDDAER